MRLFISVDPPAAAVAHLAAVVDALEVSRANQPGHSTRLTRPEQWHVTLAFLGELPPAKADAAQTALDRVAAEPFDVCFAGGGTFGRGQSAILWAGIDGDVDGLRHLADTIRRELRRARVPFDHKGFKPHLTLSRPGSRVGPAEIAADVATLAGYRGPPWPVDAVHLVQSVTVPDPSGPRSRHTRVRTAALAPR